MDLMVTSFLRGWWEYVMKFLNGVVKFFKGVMKNMKKNEKKMKKLLMVL
jgi:hypothetical protein